MQEILEGQQGVLSRLDDILVYGSSKEQHDERLHQVLKRIEEAGVTLNEKCEFQKESINFSSHIIDANGFRTDPQNTKPILEMKDPKSVPEVRRILGMFNHLQKFVPSTADTTKPLRDLLRKGVSWQLGLAQKDAFETIKTSLIKSQTLAMFDPLKQTILSADASSYGLGAVIFQVHGGLGAVIFQVHGKETCPIAYHSRSLTLGE